MQECDESGNQHTSKQGRQQSRAHKKSRSVSVFQKTSGREEIGHYSLCLMTLFFASLEVPTEDAVQNVHVYYDVPLYTLSICSFDRSRNTVQGDILIHESELPSHAICCAINKAPVCDDKKRYLSGNADSCGDSDSRLGHCGLV